MNQRNNFKNNNNNNIDDEIDSFNEEDEDNHLFINKKELVHIENDTSINVDKSFDEEHSKTSTLKKGGLLINNISAINVQFSQGIDLSDKKMADPNFFTRQLNNDFGDFNDTTDNKLDNALNNYRGNKKNDLKINPSNYFETFNTMAASTEENNFNINNNIQNNLNNLILGSKRNKKIDYYSITNFNISYIGIGSINLNQNGGSDVPLRELQNKNNQLESKYFNLNEQYKKMKLEIDELNNSNKSLLELLSYWQKFYLEVKEIVLPEEKKNRNEISLNDCMDDPYRIQVIDEVKKLIIISRDKVYNNFYKNTVINFAIFNNNKIKSKINYENNLIQKRIESFVIINKIKIKNDFMGDNLINDLKKSKKFMDESDDLDHLPPIKYKEKINIGVNTDENLYNKKKNYFDSNDLCISQKVNKTTFFEIKRINNNSIIKQDNPRIKKLISNSSNQNIDFKKKKVELQIITLNNIFYKGKPSLSPLPRKFKKNTTYKFAFIQTDITNNNIVELLSFKNEKEKIIKQYEEKINTLNNYIKNNINNKTNINNNNNINEKNILSSRIINNNKKINNYIHIKNNKENNSPNKNQNANNIKKIFLPEMIPPENTYKIFMNCIKNFKYEEGIYQKYMIEDDLPVLKNFVEKMEKYFTNTSLPVLKAKKRKDYIIHTKANNESSAQKKYKERILSGNKTIFFNINSKRRNISDLKSGYERSNSVLNNNIIFNKYKAAIMSLKDD